MCERAPAQALLRLRPLWTFEAVQSLGAGATLQWNMVPTSEAASVRLGEGATLQAGTRSAPDVAGTLRITLWMCTVYVMEDYGFGYG